MTASPAEPPAEPVAESPAEPVAGSAADPVGESARARSESLASGLLGLLMLIGGVVVLVDAASLRGTGTTLGPAAAPTLVGTLLGVLGAALAVQARSALRPGDPAGVGIAPGSLRRLAVLLAVLVAFALLLPLLGWVVCATGLFTGAALLLGAPRPPRVVAYGWTLAVLVFLIFDTLIGLTLPAGPWGF